MIHPSITIQGNIISGEILEKINNEEKANQSPAAFGLPQNARVKYPDGVNTLIVNHLAILIKLFGKKSAMILQIKLIHLAKE